MAVRPPNIGIKAIEIYFPNSVSFVRVPPTQLALTTAVCGAI
jgi:hypothetical protein